jgi:hypothetical protein
MIAKTFSWRSLLLAAILLSAPCLASAQTPTIPTAEQLRMLYGDGRYHACLQEISRLLFLKGAAAANVNRPELLLLRGDCLVKLKDSRTALKAYQEAEKAATHDPETALWARAGVLILKNCRGLSYMPPGVQPIDVTTDDGWKQAAGAIYDNIWRNSQSDFRAAQSASDISPIIRVVPTITDLVALIRVSGADSSQLKPMAANIGQRARDIIGRLLNQLDGTTAAVERSADVVLNVTYTYSWYGGWPAVRQGLSTPDRDALSQVVDTASQAYDLALQGKEAAFLVGGNEDKWQATADWAADTRDHAQRILDAE